MREDEKGGPAHARACRKQFIETVEVVMGTMGEAE